MNHPFSDLHDSVNPNTAAILGNIGPEAEDDIPDDTGVSTVTKVCLLAAAVLVIGIAIYIIFDIL